MTLPAQRAGIVVIGRNEGQRLVDCLSSLAPLADHTVYVDSGSNDGSQVTASAAGVAILDLDMDYPFTAARARNAGYACLLKAHPDLEFVQFVDGDCTLDAGWMTAAMALLDEKPEVALVCGRRRERYPDRSIYNELCDREWDGPVGSIVESGGDFLVRTAAFSDIAGFRASLIAGEEPELCLRLRELGWQIWRLPREMTMHDANIIRLGQWWRRAVRSGHAFAEVSWLHRNSPKRIWQRNVIRALMWSAIAPVAIVGATVAPWCSVLLLLYPLDIVRQVMRNGTSSLASWRGAFFSALGKFPEAHGILKYHMHRLSGRRSGLIEYK